MTLLLITANLLLLLVIVAGVLFLRKRFAERKNKKEGLDN